MNQVHWISLSSIVFSFLLLACKNKNKIDVTHILKDSSSIQQGNILFAQHCTACHQFKQVGIGPDLGGLTHEVHMDWIKAFIKNPKKMIDSGDTRAAQLFSKYKSYMTPFPFLEEKSLNEIIAYIHTKEKTIYQPNQNRPLTDPISDTIPLSTLVAEIKLVIQIPASDTSKIMMTRITKLDYEPHTKELFLVDLRGKLYRINDNKAAVYMDISKLRPKFVHKPGLATGFGSFAFHPEFNKNGLMYTSHSEPAGSSKADFAYHDSISVALQWVLTEWKTSIPKNLKFVGQSREILRINVESVIHGMQEIVFRPQSKPGDEDYGLLYIGLGDGGSVEHGFPHLVLDLTQIWGNVLRIDPRGHNSSNTKYGIPKSNPFHQLKDSVSALGEIYARGFRNPHRITWTQDGKMLVSNIGHANIESLNLILPGHDYGWPVTEGPFKIDIKGDMKKVYALPKEYNKYNITYPIALYDHDEGLAISGGYEYTGDSIPELKGKFLFGDIAKGRLFYIDSRDIALGKTAPIYEWKISINGIIKTLKEACGHTKVDLHFGKDADGEMYIMTKPDGKLYKIISAKQQ